MENNQSAGAESQSVTEMVKEIAESSKQMIDAGTRVLNDLEQIEHRVEHAMDWQSRLMEHPFLLIGGALLGGWLTARMLSSRS